MGTTTTTKNILDAHTNCCCCYFYNGLLATSPPMMPPTARCSEEKRNLLFIVVSLHVDSKYTLRVPKPVVLCAWTLNKNAGVCLWKRKIFISFFFPPQPKWKLNISLLLCRIWHQILLLISWGYDVLYSMSWAFRCVRRRTRKLKQDFLHIFHFNMKVFFSRQDVCCYNFLFKGFSV